MTWASRWPACALLLAVCLVGGLRSAGAQEPGRRVALLVANGAYQSASVLANPRNDARLVAGALRKAGFETVDVRADLGNAAFRAALREFRGKAAGADVALVYYAGHGIEAKGRNWLIPTDAVLASDLDLTDEAVDLDRVLEDVSGAKLRVVILDACRDNPFGRSWRSGTRSVRSGLGRVEADDVLVIYAAAPGQVASDGNGLPNSPFATALARRLVQPDLAVQLLGGMVRDDVLRATGNIQRPFVSASMTGEPYYLVAGPRESSAPVAAASGPTATVPVAPAAPSPAALEALTWQGALSANTVAGYEDYLRQYPQGRFRVQAQENVTRLRAAASAPAPARAPSSTPSPALAAAPPREQATSTRAGAVFRDALRSGGEGPQMVIVGAGRFEQGSPSYEGDRAEDEGPLREVQVASFALGRYEVTRGEYRAFVAATGYRTDAERDTPLADTAAQGCWSYLGEERFEWKAGTNWRDPGYPQTDAHPVVCVSWNDAQAYAEWLSRETGKRYRLPTESELEYANRAGTTTTWPWGRDGDAGCGRANYADAGVRAEFSNWTTASCNDGHVFTAPVGTYAANAFGLHDTAGNVYEWALDCYGSYAGAPVDGRAREDGDCSRRVVRGGGWDGRPAGLRSAYRFGVGAASRFLYGGFRVARVP